MSDTVIRVENLGKKYIIGHQQQERYTALRDVITNKVKSLGSLINPQAKNENPAFEEFWALKDVSFDIKQGDRVGIIGRNGAGKSTLLKVLSRITEPTTGSIKIKGRVASLLEVGTGFHPELTGRENIFLNGAILGMGKEEIKRKFDEIVAFAEVEKFLDTPVKRYSSGMYVRLAFAVAAHLEPEILIVDEVLAVGDAQFQKKCLGKMEDVAINQGRTIIFVSHQMGVVSNLCNSCLGLNKGILTYEGNVTEGIQQYLASNNTSAVYAVDDNELLESSPAALKEITTSGIDGNDNSNFNNTESIVVQVTFKLNENIPGLCLGIGLDDRFSSRVTTWVSKVADYYSRNQKEYTVELVISSGIIAPNLYSFTVALFVPRGKVYHVLNSVCPVHIHDSGTDLSIFEGIDYGSVIIPNLWRVPMTS
ncbi:polysaccharide ABC transporter ATP-binding protein [Dolichospermum circinale]|uniref:ABC transporter ATP-binding protein n=1 Tax=Dolichospermum circinale TaxID=109265 RepID=UPI00232E4549|nr:polysaccharide ABC transporter ATP-binding protein [Dolichospermum circinale]MDB9456382.1 polysaccharide ABC transporter ATP-binding protein [Dolichospermum circinale CS-541/06]MDB9462979.1 polysaccharide ABC transporter ATP-binding protein [Dolichospermum circinale CS-541/04]